MNCTFYRPNTPNTTEFENIIGKMAYDLHLLETESHDEWCVYRYFYALSRHALPLANNPKMSFFGLDVPNAMPSDSRVAYFYQPTYLASAFMMKAVLLYPSLMNEVTFLDSDLDFSVEIVRKTLASCLLGCTGRDFDGAGILPLKKCFKIFEEAGAAEFIEKYPELCPEFNKLYQATDDFLKSGKSNASEEWYNHYR